MVKATTGESGDYARALTLLRRINALQIDGRSIQSFFLYEGYNFWQAFQMAMFLQIRRLSKDPGRLPKEVTTPPAPGVGFFVQGTLALLCTIVALLWTRLRSSRILVYSIDTTPKGSHRSDFRLKELYEALEKEGTHYTEIFHSPLSVFRLLKHLLIRKRIAMYLPALDLLCTLVALTARNKRSRLIEKIDLSNFSVDERDIVRFVLHRASDNMSHVPIRVALLRRIIRLGRFKAIFAIDDARAYFELLCAAKLEHVPTCIVQHGHYTKYHVGFFAFAERIQGNIIIPEILVVWNDYWKSELKRLGTYIPDASIVVGGNKHIPQLSVDKRKLVREEAVTVLIPYETDAPKDEVKRFLQRLQTCPDIEMLFKPRPDISIAVQWEEYGIKKSPKVRILTPEESWVPISAVVIGTYTSMLYDAVAYHIPVGIIRCSLDYADDMVKNGLAEHISSNGSDLCAAIVRLARTPHAVLAERAEHLLSERNLVITLADLIKKYKYHEHSV
jgi:hypothetical protein